MLNLLIIIGFSYLLGSIPFSFLVAKSMGKIDIREHGSKNAGATNVYRVLGAKAGIIALASDISKGIIATLVAKYFFGFDMALVAGASVIVGHCFPFALGFKGGKGVATGVGTIIGLFPSIAGILFLVMLAIVLTTEYVALGSVICALLFPLFGLVFKMPATFYFYSIPASLFVIYRHKANIKRLLNGTENKTKLIKARK